MKFENSTAPAIKRPFPSLPAFKKAVGVSVFLFISLVSRSQAVTEIITDFKGYWKSSAATPNAIKPDNSHNLLAFRYNGILYSTGVNHEVLASRGESFQPADFWSLPVSGLTGTITSNTKVGLGALYDGVYGGASNPPPAWGIDRYLTDGIKGLDIGTCIANLPVGTMTFPIANIQPASIGDGIPDILVTQIADPSGSFDRYEFTDANGVRVGNYKDIVFTNITPVGTWTADFYEAVHNPLILTSGFTQTDRPIRLWAADLSDLGITAANYAQIRNFRITLCGNSDVAFVAYSNTAINLQNPLPVQFESFSASGSKNKVRLDWKTASEENADRFMIERSGDGVSFTSIGSIAAKNGIANAYTFFDNAPLPGKNYYRLKQLDESKNFKHSAVIAFTSQNHKLKMYPNPAKDVLYIEHGAASGDEMIYLYSSAGVLVKQVKVLKNETVSKLDLNGLPAGSYVACYEIKNTRDSHTFVIR
ncbi:MAG: T9SS type A sorting domain-containing protein [Flavisolibacter sp.]|nr:T9SS type A sorting domain-containing protein [Flavisolibacter sp.]